MRDNYRAASPLKNTPAGVAHVLAAAARVSRVRRADVPADLHAARVQEGAGTYSQLLAFSGGGSIVGALVIAWLGKFKRMGLTALIMQAIYGALIIAFSMSRTLWLSEVLLFFTGAALMVVFSTVTSLIQLLAPNEMRGRVMSIYMVAFRGGMPLGSLVSGYMATDIARRWSSASTEALILVAAYSAHESRGRQA
jgi:predicted MFS family arabinose efflux permease